MSRMSVDENVVKPGTHEIYGERGRQATKTTITISKKNDYDLITEINFLHYYGP